jgi:L-ascorbate metabolism protein UlaG (beta-lactamase superfamily)
MRKIVLIAAILFSSLNFSYAQTQQITIRFIGNCGLHISDGSTNIYTDFPYVSGFNQYMEYDDSELSAVKDSSIFIFTHKHPDHYSSRRMKRILKAKGGAKYGSWDIAELEELSLSIPDFSIKAYKTKHFLSRKHYSYLIEWHGKRIFLSGDTEHAEVVVSIEDLDWAFMPAWLIQEVYVYQEKKVDSKMIAVYHIGEKDNINIESEKILMLNKQGEEISIAY